MNGLRLLVKNSKLQGKSYRAVLHLWSTLALFFVLVLLSSCTSLLTNTIIYPAVGNLQKQTDLDLVCEGAPSYLLMIDSMIASDPDNRDLLEIGAQSYSAYTAALAECGTREKRIGTIADKAHLYGRGLLATILPVKDERKAEQVDERLSQLRRRHVPTLFWGGMAWLTWVRQQQGTPAAMADMVVIEKVMARVLQLEPAFQAGSVHLFFGGYYAAKPAMLGGDPARSRDHFEQALVFSKRQFLLVQTTYAQTLARQTLDRELHDRLLREVMEFTLSDAPEYALSNQIAKRQAERLLKEDYFAD